MINNNIFAMIMNEERFKGFTKKEIADTSASAEVIIALSIKSRNEVDEIVNKALSAGGASFRDPVEYGVMYQWGFQDVDGHFWEVVFMDESALQEE